MNKWAGKCLFTHAQYSSFGGPSYIGAAIGGSWDMQKKKNGWILFRIFHNLYFSKSTLPPFWVRFFFLLIGISSRDQSFWRGQTDATHTSSGRLHHAVGIVLTIFFPSLTKSSVAIKAKDEIQMKPFKEEIELLLNWSNGEHFCPGGKNKPNETLGEVIVTVTKRKIRRQ